VRLAVGFNPVFSARDGIHLSTKAEAAGFDSLWMHESLFQRDTVTYLASMALSTMRIRLGSGIINTFTRHPVTTAATFGSLSELSGGRVILGLGLGSFPTIPLIGHQIFPVEKTRPLRRLKEYIQVVQQVWSGGKIDFDGEFFKVHNLQMGFKLPSPVPIYVASLSPKTLEYAATVADGLILSPALNTVWGTERMVEHVRRGESLSGRTPERASYMLASVDKDPARAAQAVKDYYFFDYQLAEVVRPEVLLPYGLSEERLAPMKEAWRKGDVPLAKRSIPDEAVEVLTLTGTPDHVKERISQYVKAGVTLPVIMPIGDVDFAIQSLAPASR